MTAPPGAASCGAEVRLHGVAKHYLLGGQVVRALDDVTLHIAAGECAAIMGPSGSGKSTLLNVIGGLDVPTSGQVWVGGEQIAALSAAALCAFRRRRIGFVFQDFSLIPGKTALQNAELPMIFAGVPRAQRLARARQALADVGLADRAAHTPEQLSGGQQQRVAIARALVNDPDAILADEPTGNLDSAAGAQVLDALLHLARSGRTVLIVTHDRDTADRADRVVLMRDGRIVPALDRAPPLPASPPAGGDAQWTVQRRDVPAPSRRVSRLWRWWFGIR